MMSTSSSPFDLRNARGDEEAGVPHVPNYAMHFLFESFGAGGAAFGRKLLGARPLTQDSLEHFREIILAKWVIEDKNSEDKNAEKRAHTRHEGYLRKTHEANFL